MTELVQEISFPLGSVAVNVTVDFPSGYRCPNGTLRWASPAASAMVAENESLPAELSVASGAGSVTSAPSSSPTASARKLPHVTTGGSASITVTSTVQVATPPALSAAANGSTVLPSGICNWLSASCLTWPPREFTAVLLMGECCLPVTDMVALSDTVANACPASVATSRSAGQDSTPGPPAAAAAPAAPPAAPAAPVPAAPPPVAAALLPSK